MPCSQKSKSWIRIDCLHCNRWDYSLRVALRWAKKWCQPPAMRSRWPKRFSKRQECFSHLARKKRNGQKWLHARKEKWTTAGNQREGRAVINQCLKAICFPWLWSSGQQHWLQMLESGLGAGQRQYLPVNSLKIHLPQDRSERTCLFRATQVGPSHPPTLTKRVTQHGDCWWSWSCLFIIVLTTKTTYHPKKEQHEKMFSITNCYRTENHFSKWDKTSHGSEWPSFKNLQITNAAEGVKREPSYIVGGNVNCCNYHGKQYGGSSEKLKIVLAYNLAIPLLGIYLDKTIIWKDTCTWIFIASLFTIAKT